MAHKKGMLDRLGQFVQNIFGADQDASLDFQIKKLSSEMKETVDEIRNSNESLSMGHIMRRNGGMKRLL